MPSKTALLLYFSSFLLLLLFQTGKARRGDVCVFFSHSGNTLECVFAASHLRQRGVHILSVIGHDDSKLAECSDAYISYKLDHELTEPIGGVPTTSVILQVRDFFIYFLFFSLILYLLKTVFGENALVRRNH